MIDPVSEPEGVLDPGSGLIPGDRGCRPRGRAGDGRRALGAAVRGRVVPADVCGSALAAGAAAPARSPATQVGATGVDGRRRSVVDVLGHVAVPDALVDAVVDVDPAAA